jgi:cell division protein FtsA
MKINSPSLFIEINNFEYIFAVGDKDQQDNFKLIYEHIVPTKGIEKTRITNLDLVFDDIKKNIYLIEQKLNFIFKEVVLILNNFECSFINLTGFKKLNGSQILKENIAYILNSLKSNVDETEEKKTILHIFNSNYSLDKKKIENLPIGLFGDFYSHELSFCLINNNDYKNLNNIFLKCNLKIKKILLKSFVEGSFISNKNENLNTFFKIAIKENTSQLLYFENDSLKFEQKFSFGSDLVIRDLSKITSLKIETIKKIIKNTKLAKDVSKDELIEKELFEDENYVKIKKRLILKVTEARIQEFAEIMIIKNVNLLNYVKKDKVIFLTIDNQLHFHFFKDIYKFFFSINNQLSVKFMNNIATDDLISQVNKIVHYGWNKEAIPVTHTKKSLIAKFFDLIFG